MKKKTITELRSTLFKTFNDVVTCESPVIPHKNGTEIVMAPVSKISELEQEVELHKNLAICYAQALRGEGISSSELKSKLKSKEEANLLIEFFK